MSGRELEDALWECVAQMAGGKLLSKHQSQLMRIAPLLKPFSTVDPHRLLPGSDKPLPSGCQPGPFTEARCSPLGLLLLHSPFRSAITKVFVRGGCLARILSWGLDTNMIDEVIDGLISLDMDCCEQTLKAAEPSKKRQEEEMCPIDLAIHVCEFGSVVQGTQSNSLLRAAQLCDFSAKLRNLSFRHYFQARGDIKETLCLIEMLDSEEAHNLHGGRVGSKRPHQAPTSSQHNHLIDSLSGALAEAACSWGGSSYDASTRIMGYSAGDPVAFYHQVLSKLPSWRIMLIARRLSQGEPHGLRDVAIYAAAARQSMGEPGGLDSWITADVAAFTSHARVVLSLILRPAGMGELGGDAAPLAMEEPLWRFLEVAAESTAALVLLEDLVAAESRAGSDGPFSRPRC